MKDDLYKTPALLLRNQTGTSKNIFTLIASDYTAIERSVVFAKAVSHAPFDRNLFWHYCLQGRSRTMQHPDLPGRFEEQDIVNNILAAHQYRSPFRT